MLLKLGSPLHKQPPTSQASQSVMRVCACYLNRVTTRQLPPFRRDAGTWLTYLLLGYFSFILSTFGSFLPFLRLELGLTFTQTSAHSSLFALGLLAASLSANRLGAFSAGRLLWSGALGMAAGIAVVMLAPSLTVSLSGFFLMGGSGALTLIQVSTLLSAKHGPNRTRALGEANALASFCAVLAPLAIGGAAAWGLGWRTGLGVAPLFLGMLALSLSKTSFPITEHAVTTARSPLPGRYWRFWTTLLLCVAAEFGVIFWAVDFLGSGPLTRTAASLGLSGFLLAMLLGRTLGTRLAERLEAENVVLGSLALAFTGFLVYWLGGAAWLQLGGLFVTGLGVANLYPFVLSLALSVAPPDALGTASARIPLASGVAILFSPFILGALADLTTLAAAQIFLPLCLAAAFLTMWLARAEPAPELEPIS